MVVGYREGKRSPDDTPLVAAGISTGITHRDVNRTQRSAVERGGSCRHPRSEEPSGKGYGMGEANRVLG